ncbi:hypothetical protein NNO04_21145 [Citrobacter sp. Awk 4]|uniref:hypothetical protein n=1 Tax=Citrobacter sp. Awk 4 TaxID=2963955 RepID=UPI002302A44B|nr:hypothetical protein [Citrobacter sp. Awk 4]MDA8481175.1 hypothetical protein [Citrobacter sp. Awk 4]
MKTKILLFAIVILLSLVLGGHVWYSKKINPRIDCSGYAVWDINHEVFSGDISYQMHNRQGIITLTGILKTSDAQLYKVSRVIYFTYEKIRKHYILTSSSIVQFPSDNLKDTVKQKALPAFYLASGVSFSLLINKYREGWAFTTVGSPSLLCMDVN